VSQQNARHRGDEHLEPELPDEAVAGRVDIKRPAGRVIQRADASSLAASRGYTRRALSSKIFFLSTALNGKAST
jgi:hypothetical protein